MKNWPKPKSVCDIHIFLGFANFYQLFIQGFSKIPTLLTSILKTTRLLDSSALSKNDDSKSASSKNDNSKSASGRNDGNSELNRFDVSSNSVKHAKNSGKSKSKKFSKS